MYRIIPIPKELVPPEVWVILIRRLNDYRMKIIEGTGSFIPDELVYELGLTNAFVLARMKRWQDYSKKGYATVSNSQLAKDCNMSESSIIRAKKELIQKGYIEVSSEKVNKVNTVSKILVLYDYKMTAPKKETTNESTTPTMTEDNESNDSILYAISNIRDIKFFNHLPYRKAKECNRDLGIIADKFGDSLVEQVYNNNILRKSA